MKKGALVAVAVAVAVALGFVAQRQLSGPVAPQAAAPAESTAAAAPESPSEAQSIADAAKVPETLPHFELADREGIRRSLHDWAGRPLLVNYWATWCGPCRREIPLLNELRAERAAQNLEVIGIAVDFREDVLKYAEETTISYPLLIGEEDGLEAVKAMGVAQAAFPFTVFADSRQRIVALKVGELHRDEAELILDRVAAVDAGRLELAAAREEITAGLKELAVRRAVSTG